MTTKTPNRLVIRDRIVRVDRVFRRFDLEHRLEHLALMLAVGMLLLTGLPQKYSEWPFSVTLIGWLGGIESTRLIHRGAAILLIAVAALHVLGTAYRFLVLRLPPHIVLLTHDWRDLLQDLRRRLGRADEPPAMGRFTYQEKLLYWAVVWSVAILVLTGLMMWNPIAATRYLTGEIVPVAKRAHGSEALLLLMVGLGWHLWQVLLKQRNWSIFSGLLAESEMLRDHPLEWDAIMQGRDRLPLDLGVVRRRRWRFAVFAAASSLVVAGCLIGFLGFEQTAVVTHPQRQPVQVVEGTSLAADPGQTASAIQPTWGQDIQPMLARACGDCHGEEDSLNLADYDTILDGGLVVPGDPGASSLVSVQAGQNHPGQLSSDELATVIVWIGSGAPIGPR